MEGLASLFLAVVLILDLLLFPPLIVSIGQAGLQREKDLAVVHFFKDLIIRKTKFPRAKIVSQGRIDDVLDKIQAIAGKEDIEAQIGASVETDKQNNEAATYVRKIFTVQASGSFKDLGTFLTAVRDMPDAILDIDSMHIVSDKKNAAQLQAQIIFSILTAKDDENQ